VANNRLLPTLLRAEAEPQRYATCPTPMSDESIKAQIEAMGNLVSGIRKRRE